jgi:hypothetical protein
LLRAPPLPRLIGAALLGLFAVPAAAQERAETRWYEIDAAEPAAAPAPADLTARAPAP